MYLPNSLDNCQYSEREYPHRIRILPWQACHCEIAVRYPWWWPSSLRVGTRTLRSRLRILQRHGQVCPKGTVLERQNRVEKRERRMQHWDHWARCPTQMYKRLQMHVPKQDSCIHDECILTESHCSWAWPCIWDELLFSSPSGQPRLCHQNLPYHRHWQWLAGDHTIFRCSVPPSRRLGEQWAILHKFRPNRLFISWVCVCVSWTKKWRKQKKTKKMNEGMVRSGTNCTVDHYSGCCCFWNSP